jgi:hypothetical protein
MPPVPARQSTRGPAPCPSDRPERAAPCGRKAAGWLPVAPFNRRPGGRVGGRVAQNSSGSGAGKRQIVATTSRVAVVEPRGIEPLTSSLRSRSEGNRPTNLLGCRPDRVPFAHLRSNTRRMLVSGSSPSTEDRAFPFGIARSMNYTQRSRRAIRFLFGTQAETAHLPWQGDWPSGEYSASQAGSGFQGRRRANAV